MSDVATENRDGSPLTGGCLCGRVQYRIDRTGAGSSPGTGDPVFGPVANCHCTMCRKAQGGAFGTNATVSTARFALEQGADSITEYESTPGKLRCFCGVCGSPIYSRRLDDPTHVRIRLGTLNEDPGVRAQFHACVDTKAPWFEITDDLPRYGTWAQAQADLRK